MLFQAGKTVVFVEYMFVDHFVIHLSSNIGGAWELKEKALALDRQCLSCKVTYLLQHPIWVQACLELLFSVARGLTVVSRPLYQHGSRDSCGERRLLAFLVIAHPF